MAAKILVPLAVSGLAGCYAMPTTAMVAKLTSPTPVELPFHEHVPGLPPDQDHGPHGDDEPGEALMVSNSLAASGVMTNTSASMMINSSQSWVLSTSAINYAHDVEFAKLFQRAGASLILRVVDHDAEDAHQHLSPS